MGLLTTRRVGVSSGPQHRWDSAGWARSLSPASDIAIRIERKGVDPASREAARPRIQ